jgi:hypothetical protein
MLTRSPLIPATTARARITPACRRIVGSRASPTTTGMLSSSARATSPALQWRSTATTA